MQQVFSRQPGRASYCYFDGVVLQGPTNGHAHSSVAATSFRHRSCSPPAAPAATFDELALACHADWAEAASVLRQGFLERFFGGLGRADLALAAREAARFPDRDRGLDQLLANLPTASSTRLGCTSNNRR